MMMTAKTGNEIIIVRTPEDIYQAHGTIDNGRFSGHWHFSFDEYYDRDYTHFGTLRVFNDDTLSPGAVWPLHPHRNIEVVTYCAAGVFRHADERGRGDILKKGWVQRTTIGRGMWHAEINDSDEEPVRFIQMWFTPSQFDLEPSLERKQVERPDRTDKLLPLVSNDDPDALLIASDARVYATYMRHGKQLPYGLETGRGAYLYVVEGGPVSINGHEIETLGAAKIIGSKEAVITAAGDAELLLVEVPLAVGNTTP